MESDWDFLVALAVTAAVIALAMLGYAVLAWRRRRLDDLSHVSEEAERAEVVSKPDAVFFKRYSPPQ